MSKIRIGICMLGAVLALAALLFLYPAPSDASSVHACDADIVSTETDRVTRILVLGTDRSAGLTDSIFILTVNEGTKEASVLQIPRDTYAEYTEHDYKKINGASRAIGDRALKQFLSNALQIPIHAYVRLNLDVLDRVIDDIGGVDVEIPQEMEYRDPAQDLEIRLPSGRVHLDGKMAEQFVRYRSGYANADLGRLDAQKLFLRAVAMQCKHLRLSQMLRVTLSALPNVNTDLTLPDALRLITTLMDCNAETFPMATISGQAVQGKSGAWYYVINKEGAIHQRAEYLSPTHPLQEADFDPDGIFDREDYEIFHLIYVARESELPLPLA